MSAGAVGMALTMKAKLLPHSRPAAALHGGVNSLASVCAIVGMQSSFSITMACGTVASHHDAEHKPSMALRPFGATRDSPTSPVLVLRIAEH